MIKLNDNFNNLPETYLFTEVGRRVREFQKKNPEAEVIRMDIGDVSRPLFPCVVEAMKKGIEGMGRAETFHGYGPEQGYLFLREIIAEKDYANIGLNISPDDIFIGDGAKCDLGNLGEIFSNKCKVAIMNPSYPAYTDDTVMDGRAGEYKDGKYENIIYLDCNSYNRFLPSLPRSKADLIYLCFPNNPTGEGIISTELKQWIDYARENRSVIIFDSAYVAYIRTPGIIKSIYEIEGAEEVAIEIRSFSKTAGFTGIRCGYTIVPEKLKGTYSNGKEVPIRKLWLRRQTTKFNGASFVSQIGAAAIYSDEGLRDVRENSDYYLRNARLLKEVLESKGHKVFGGIDSPYIWACLNDAEDSWTQFDRLLKECRLTSTPGIGFGSNGDKYLRLTGFNSYENTLKAVDRLKNTAGL